MRQVGPYAVGLGVAIVVLCQVLPYVRYAQVISFVVPSRPLTGEGKYWIDTAITPLIPEGAPFSLEVEKMERGSLYLHIYPSSHAGEPVGPIFLRYEVNCSRDSGSAMRTVPQSAQYLIVAIVFSGKFRLTVTSIWSPFEWLRPFTILGIALIIGGAVLVHFSRTVSQTLEIYRRKKASP